MSKYFYPGLLNDQDSLVIYKYGSNTQSVSDILLAKGYVDAADKIIEHLKCSGRTAPPDDYLIYPLLNIYFCSTEFLLKALLRKLLDHGQKNAVIF